MPGDDRYELIDEPASATDAGTVSDNQYELLPNVSGDDQYELLPSELPTGGKFIAEQTVRNVGADLKQVVPETGKALLRGVTTVPAQTMATAVEMAGDAVTALRRKWRGFVYGPGPVREGLKKVGIVTDRPANEAPDSMQAHAFEQNELLAQGAREANQNIDFLVQDTPVLARDEAVFQGSLMENPSVTRVVAGAAESVPTMAATMGAGFTPATGGAVLAMQDVADEYTRQREKGVPEETALANTLAMAVGTAVLERTGLQSITGKSPVVDALVKRMGESWVVNAAVQYGVEGATEGTQQLWQNAVAMGYDGNRRAFDGVLESALAGGLVGAALAGKPKGMKPREALKDIRDEATAAVVGTDSATPPPPATPHPAAAAGAQLAEQYTAAKVPNAAAYAQAYGDWIAAGKEGKRPKWKTSDLVAAKIRKKIDAALAQAEQLPDSPTVRSSTTPTPATVHSPTTPTTQTSAPAPALPSRLATLMQSYTLPAKAEYARQYWAWLDAGAKGRPPASPIATKDRDAVRRSVETQFQNFKRYGDQAPAAPEPVADPAAVAARTAEVVRQAADRKAFLETLPKPAKVELPAEQPVEQSQPEQAGKWLDGPLTAMRPKGVNLVSAYPEGWNDESRRGLANALKAHDAGKATGEQRNLIRAAATEMEALAQEQAPEQAAESRKPAELDTVGEQDEVPFRGYANMRTHEGLYQRRVDRYNAAERLQEGWENEEGTYLGERWQAPDEAVRRDQERTASVVQARENGKRALAATTSDPRLSPRQRELFGNLEVDENALAQGDIFEVAGYWAGLGVNVVPVRMKQGGAVPFIAAVDPRNRTIYVTYDPVYGENWESDCAHEGFHLMGKTTPAGRKMLAAVRVNSPVAKVYRATLNEWRKGVGLAPITDAQLREEIAAEIASENYEFEANGRTYDFRDTTDVELMDRLELRYRDELDAIMSPDQRELQFRGRLSDETDYRGVHRAPDGSHGEGSLDAMDRTYPDDVYSSDAARIYGDKVNAALDREAHRAIMQVRGKPDAEVTVYRAIPKGVQGEIRSGDWVTTVRKYAEMHGRRFDDGTTILARKVRAGELFTEGNSLFEFGWQPKTTQPTVVPDSPDIRFRARLPAGTYARPDRANPGETPEMRAAVDAIDQLLNEAGLPESLSEAAARERAENRLAVNPEREWDQLRAGKWFDVRNGQEDTAVAHRLLNTQGLDLLRAGDVESVRQLVGAVYQYREQGSDLARSMAMRRDRLEKPAERNQRLIVEALTATSDTTRTEIRKAIKDGDLQKVAKLEAQAAQRTLDAMAELKDMGYDPANLDAETLSDPDQVAEIIRTSQEKQANFGDMVLEYWVNVGLLGSPKTVFQNLGGTYAYVMWTHTVDRMAQGILNTMTRQKGAPDIREAVEAWKVVAPGMHRAAWNAAKMAFRTEQPQLLLPGSKLDAPMAAIPGKVGTVARLPGRALRFGDEYCKRVAYELTVAELAYAQAKAEGRQGPDRIARAQALAGNPSVEMLTQAVRNARTETFTGENGPIVQAIQKLKTTPGWRYPVWAVLPFTSAPGQLIRTAVRRSPLGSLRMMFRGLQAAAGKGAYAGHGEVFVKDLAEQVVSAALLWIGLGLIRGDDNEEGVVTGSAKYTPRPGERSMRLTQAPPTSVRFGDNWYSYAAMDPASSQLQIMADAVNAMRAAGAGRGKDAAAGAVDALKGLVRDRTYLSGLAEIVSFLESGERGLARTAQYLSGTFASFAPRIWRDVWAATDPALRDMSVRTRDDKAAAYLKRTGQRAMPARGVVPPPKRDIWGRPVQKGDVPGSDWVWRMVVPVRTQQAVSPLNVERLVFNYNRVRERQEWPGLPSDTITINGVDREMTEAEYDAFLVRRGQLALNILGGKRLNYDRPTWTDMQIVLTAFDRANAKARREYLEGKLTDSAYGARLIQDIRDLRK